jgi:hypothetical protein
VVDDSARLEHVRKRRARINDNYRVLGIRDGAEITWFWIGIHREYEKTIRRS